MFAFSQLRWFSENVPWREGPGGGGNGPVPRHSERTPIFETTKDHTWRSVTTGAVEGHGAKQVSHMMLMASSCFIAILMIPT